eukprot:GHVQ01011420.1.p1 GENE.GHVQ01011420.1~~GHVQ01011420.1.p1  ORF type:complete len:929 (+),score=128.65 GHVQ01011420.1:107-2893(+)
MPSHEDVVMNDLSHSSPFRVRPLRLARQSSSLLVSPSVQQQHISSTLSTETSSPTSTVECDRESQAPSNPVPSALCNDLDSLNYYQARRTLKPSVPSYPSDLTCKSLPRRSSSCSKLGYYECFLSRHKVLSQLEDVTPKNDNNTNTSSLSSHNSLGKSASSSSSLHAYHVSNFISSRHKKLAKRSEGLLSAPSSPTCASPAPYRLRSSLQPPPIGSTSLPSSPNMRPSRSSGVSYLSLQLRDQYFRDNSSWLSPALLRVCTLQRLCQQRHMRRNKGQLRRHSFTPLEIPSEGEEYSDGGDGSNSSRVRSETFSGMCDGWVDEGGNGSTGDTDVLKNIHDADNNEYLHHHSQSAKLSRHASVFCNRLRNKHKQRLNRVRKPNARTCTTLLRTGSSSILSAESFPPELIKILKGPLDDLFYKASSSSSNSYTTATGCQCCCCSKKCTTSPPSYKHSHEVSIPVYCYHCEPTPALHSRMRYEPVPPVTCYDAATSTIPQPSLSLSLPAPPLLLPSPSRYQLWGGGFCIPRDDKRTTGGEDAWFMSGSLGSMGIADGVSEWKEVADIDSRAYAEDLMKGSIRYLVAYYAALQQRRDAVGKMSASDVARVCMSLAHDTAINYGSSTALLAVLQDHNLGVATLGDSGLMVLRRRHVDRMLSEQEGSEEWIRKTRNSANLYWGPRVSVCRVKQMQHSFNMPYQFAHIPSPCEWENLQHQLPELVKIAKKQYFNCYGHIDTTITPNATSKPKPPPPTPQIPVSAVQEYLYPLTIPLLPVPSSILTHFLTHSVNSTSNGDPERSPSDKAEHNVEIPPLPSTLGDSPSDVQTYNIIVKEGDLLVMASDGLFDNIFDFEIASVAGLCVSPWEAQQLFGDPTLCTSPQDIAQVLSVLAYWRSIDFTAKTPFEREAKKVAGPTGMRGGKPDDITVVAAWVV